MITAPSAVADPSSVFLPAPLVSSLPAVLAAVPRAPVLGVDDTNWRRAGTLHWLWTAVTRQFALYRIDRHRNRVACEALLQSNAGTDRRPSTV